MLGSETFDVTNIDVTTLSFGADGASPAHNLSDSFTYNDHLQDVNYDGFMDLVSHYRTRDVGIACGDESATLTGATLDGQPIEGSDSIRTVGCRATCGRGSGSKDQDLPRRTPRRRRLHQPREKLNLHDSRGWRERSLNSRADRTHDAPVGHDLQGVAFCPGAGMLEGTSMTRSRSGAMPAALLVAFPIGAGARPGP